MGQKQTVTINGRLYDALTGMPIAQSEARVQPVAQPAAKAKPQASPQKASSIHSHMQRSQTLNRQHTKKPAAALNPSKADVRARAAAPVKAQPKPTIAMSPAITKFAPHPQPAQVNTKAAPATPAHAVRSKRRQVNDVAPVRHPSVSRAHNIQKQKTAVKQPVAKPTPAATKQPAVAAPAAKPTHTPSQVIKNEAIANAMKNAPSKKEQKAPKKRSFFARHPRLLSIASASLALVMLGGYFTYINMPNLSVRVAATQAGIGATYPDYRPDGYRLNGPVAAENNKVHMKFASNAGAEGFSITQEKSGWDSSALIDNLVKPRSNDSYVTTNERGLTIYTYDGNAAWVNGGILYTIEGDAPLSSEQIRRIATSL